jgi:hypothetical protein
MVQELQSDCFFFILQLGVCEGLATNTLNEVIQEELPCLSSLTDCLCLPIKHRLNFSARVACVELVRATQEEIVPDEARDVCREGGSSGGGIAPGVTGRMFAPGHRALAIRKRGESRHGWEDPWPCCGRNRCH